MTEEGIKIITQNKKAGFDYSILESFEAGIVLKGTELKPLRNGQAQLKDSFVDFHNGEMFLVGVHISIYNPSSYNNHTPERRRKLLMNRDEINKIEARVREKGLTLIPLKMYFKKGRVKVQIALAKGKKKGDKREAIKTRDVNRNLAQKMRKNR